MSPKLVTIGVRASFDSLTINTFKKIGLHACTSLFDVYAKQHCFGALDEIRIPRMKRKLNYFVLQSLILHFHVRYG